MPGLGLRAYARHRRERGLRGGTLAAVQKAIAHGRIVPDPDGKLDPVASDAAWGDRTEPVDPAQVIVAPDPATAANTPVSTPSEVPAPAQQLEPGLMGDLARARTQKEQALAEKHQLELERMRGSVVTLEFMLAELKRIIETVNRHHENWRAAAAPRMAAAGGGDVHALQREFEDMLGRLRADLATMADDDHADPPGRPFEVA
jgi:hypothetical protein